MSNVPTGASVGFLIKTNKRNVSKYDGIFYPAGTGAVTGEANTAGAVVARTNTGKITVTLPIFHKALFGALAKLNLAASAATDQDAQIDSITLNSSGKTVMVIGTYTKDSHTAVDVAADAAAFVSWSLTVQR